MTSHLKTLYVKFILSFPVSFRFNVITILSIMLSPILKYAFFMKRYRAAVFKFDQDVSPALIWCLRPVMEYDLGLNVVVDDNLLNNAVQSKQGTVLVGYHGTFMPLFIPYLYDQKYDVKSWSIRDKETYFGRKIRHSLTPSPTAFFKAKDILKAGGFISVLIDFEGHFNRRAQEIDSQFGKMYITDSFFKLASNCYSNVVFIKYAIKGKNVVFELGKPAGLFCEPDVITKQYTHFMQKRIPAAPEVVFGLSNEAAFPQIA